MIPRLLILVGLCASLAACATATERLRQEMAPQISTDVAAQVGTAVADQVAAVLAERPPASAAEPMSTAAENQTDAAGTAYDCQSKFCKDMTVCEEAVYKLKICGYSRLDSDNDGIPCEAICSALEVTAAAIIPPSSAPTEASPAADDAEIGIVTRVVDGDTIDVLLNGKNTRVRYLQMNTPERDEPCYSEATQANAGLVASKTVRLVADKELVDRYDRLLRYIYVGDLLVNRVLVEQGWAEVVLYPPNNAHYDEFVQLEREAAAAGRGCHPTGVFADGSTTR